jgi:hypothetical protein
MRWKWRAWVRPKGLCVVTICYTLAVLVVLSLNQLDVLGSHVNSFPAICQLYMDIDVGVYNSIDLDFWNYTTKILRTCLVLYLAVSFIGMGCMTLVGSTCYIMYLTKSNQDPSSLGRCLASTLTKYGPEHSLCDIKSQRNCQFGLTPWSHTMYHFNSIALTCQHANIEFLTDYRKELLPW